MKSSVRLRRTRHRYKFPPPQAESSRLFLSLMAERWKAGLRSLSSGSLEPLLKANQPSPQLLPQPAHSLLQPRLLLVLFRHLSRLCHPSPPNHWRQSLCLL